MSNIEEIFKSQGGNFVVPPSLISEKLSGIKAFIFDWDGVFNDGFKRDNLGSPFSEADSMGLNMLRFSYYLKYNFIPKVFIITGENNQPALTLSNREAFAGVFLNVKNKTQALDRICQEHALLAAEVAFSYDDILDLSLAQKAGLRFMVNRSASPMLRKMVINESWVDYITANEGGNHSVREICELVIGLNGNYEDVVDERVKFDKTYTSYLSERNQIEPAFYTGRTGEIEPLKP